MADDDTTINDDDLKEISDDAFDEIVEIAEEDVVAPAKESIFGEVDPDAGTDEEDIDFVMGDFDDEDSF